MPRKPLLYTDELPYHIVARCNNKEWYKGPLEQVWQIYISELIKLNQRFRLQIHAFTLMSNHYHMIVSCHKDYNLGYIMCNFQRRTADRINLISGRINHCYGGRYKGSLITNSAYYANAMKYVLMNPLNAGIVDKVEDWKYSASSLHKTNPIPISSHILEKDLHFLKEDVSLWLNTKFSAQIYKKMQKGIIRSQFSLSGVKDSTIF